MSETKDTAAREPQRAHRGRGRINTTEAMFAEHHPALAGRHAVLRLVPRPTLATSIL